MIRIFACVIAVLLTQISLAETERDYLSKYGEIFILSVSEGVLRAKLDAACLNQVNEKNQSVIAKPSECGTEADMQINTFKDTPELSRYITDIKHLKSRYGLE